jgi:hypothetical protein
MPRAVFTFQRASRLYFYRTDGVALEKLRGNRDLGDGGQALGISGARDGRGGRRGLLLVSGGRSWS